MQSVPFEFLIRIMILVPLIVCVLIGVAYYKFKISTPFVLTVGNVLVGLIGMIGILMSAVFGFSLQYSIIIYPIAVPLAAILIYLQYWYFREPLKQLTGYTYAIADGDLTKEMVQTLRKDELGAVLNGFTSMYTSLRETLKNTSSVANHLATSAQEMASSAEEVNASSEEISSITQQISRGTQHQTEQINTTIKIANDMKEQFTQQIQGIGTAAELIETISSQVNMLALNASIEAARAGEYGRGFAVVADNIRRLADETKMSLVEVNQIIGALQESIDQEVDKIMSAIQNTALISEETSAGAEEASAATEEQAATMQEMSASAQELARLAANLEIKVKQFKLPSG
ncbi:MAG: methyl-accepting chemotaxis protein [Promethearchaeota archaeon]